MLGRWLTTLRAAHAAQQSQLRGTGLGFGVHLQGLGVTLFGQLAVHIRQIAVGCGIAGVGLQGFFQKGFGFFELAFGRVQHPQVVVGLGMVGMRLGDLFESLDRLVDLPLLGLNHAFHEAPLHRLGRIFALGLNQLASFIELTALKGFFDGFFRCRWRLGQGGRVQPDQTHGQCKRGQTADLPQKRPTP